ncbi:MAG: tetratricopeptide (TPR) repeat protein [Arenicella sp.]|jgi:tetratricopeptide (TPR) repeat protein
MRRLGCFSTIVLLLLTGCISSPRDAQDVLTTSDRLLPAFNQRLFEPPTVISDEEIFHLSQEQRADFFQFLNDPKFVSTPRHVRVATYMGLILDQFTFSDKTLTTRQSLASKSGNCLSLTVLTTAFAELAGVDVAYQLLDQNPIYSIDRGLLVTSDHLRAVLRSQPTAGESFSSVSRVRIDYYQTDGLSYIDNISTNYQRSLFYSNLAVGNLFNDDIDSAYAYAARALDIYKSNASALVTMGIVHRKRGDLAKAEEIYLHGAKYFDKAPTFIGNYVALLNSQNRDVDLNQLVRVGSSKVQDHPWQWIRAGKKSFNSGDYDKAISFYEHALDLAPDLHQVYLLAGDASYANGNKKESRQYLVQALSVANQMSDRSEYKRKLEAFNRM